MRIRIITAEQTLTAVLKDSATTRDLASLLPLDLTVSDYNRTEKVANLPRRLSTSGAPKGLEPVAGDLAYYAPWGNLAIYYRDFDDSPGLVHLGHLEGGADEAANISDGQVRIELIPR